jgi:purine-binding chemotaxis protein CheW
MAQTNALHDVTAANGGTQYLIFRLGAEEYAVEILRVQEIKGFSTVTPIPYAPPQIKGVINLRGSVVPVIGLRERFGMPSLAYDKTTVIVVVNIGAKVIGIVVDAVTDVLAIGRENLDTAPDLGPDIDTSFIVGMARLAERLVVVLDVEKALGHSLIASAESHRSGEVAEAHNGDVT